MNIPYFQKEFYSDRKRIYVAAAIVAVLLILLITAIVVGVRKQMGKSDDAAVVPETSATPSLEASPSASPTPDVSPSPSSSPEITSAPSLSTPAAQLPTAAKAKLDAFFAAYKAKDIQALSTMFVPDTTTELKSLHSRLFTGLDVDGSPGGPTLFSSNSASQSTAEYTLLSSTQEGQNWKVTLSEKRLSGTGGDAGTVQTTMVLSQDGGEWKVSQYFHVDSAGKYDGFLIN